MQHCLGSTDALPSTYLHPPRCHVVSSLLTQPPIFLRLRAFLYLLIGPSHGPHPPPMSSGIKHTEYWPRYGSSQMPVTVGKRAVVAVGGRGASPPAAVFTV